MTRAMHRTVLMVGFHFPPSALSSGHLRLLGFTKHLPKFGWTPIVLSANERAYYAVDPKSSEAIPDGCLVRRAFALDTKRHLGMFGRYPAMLAQPDRWVSWWPAAVWAGMRLIRRHRVSAIWSTYPIMTAHCIAHTLSGRTGLPWIADFRDPVAASVAGQDPLTAANQIRWERRVLSRAACTVFTTPGSMRSCAERYPAVASAGRLMVVPNGFDEEDFAGLPHGNPPQPGARLHLVHAGVLYPEGRNPVPFFEALAHLQSSGAISPGDLRITLRASGSEPAYAAELVRLGLQSIVTLAPPCSYHDALAEQATADGLLLFQGSQFDRQIPAKLYEYLRLSRPVFALVGEHGDTRALLRDVGGAIIAPLDAVPVIEAKFLEFLRAVLGGGMRTSAQEVQRYSRNRTARQLASLLSRVADGEPAHDQGRDPRTLRDAYSPPSEPV